MPRDYLRFRIGAVLLGVLLAWVLAEGSLQLAALFVRHAARPPELAPPEASVVGPVILCVGDSFTYGSGSSSAATSYPAQMEAWLRANDPTGAPWRVCNGGWPGRNSSEALRKLPGFLQEAHPDFVCVLVGLNNRWNQRGGDEGEDAGEALKREPASLATAAGAARGEAGENVATARRALASDAGRIEAAAKEGVGTGWTWRLPRLFAIVVAAVRERTDPSFHATVPASADSVLAPPSDASAPIDLEDPVAALDSIRERRRRTADVRPLLEALEGLRPRIRALGDPKAAAALVLLLADVSRYPQAEEEGRLARERFGLTPELANALVKPLSHLARVDEAIELGRLAVADAPNDPDRLRRLAEALRIGRRSEEALTIFTRLYGSNHDRDEYEKQVRKIDRAVLMSEERCTAALADVELSEVDRAAVLESLRRVREEKGAPPYEAALARDLSQLCKLAQDAGARPVIVGYPLPLGTLNPALRQAAEDGAVTFVDTEPVFRELLRTEKRERYFVPDGHCNDEGYRIMAAEVGRAVLDLRKAAAAP